MIGEDGCDHRFADGNGAEAEGPTLIFYAASYGDLVNVLLSVVSATYDDSFFL